MPTLRAATHLFAFKNVNKIKIKFNSTPQNCGSPTLRAVVHFSRAQNISSVIVILCCSLFKAALTGLGYDDVDPLLP